MVTVKRIIKRKPIKVPTTNIKILGKYGSEEYKHDKDVISKEINGERVTFYSDIALAWHKKKNPNDYEHAKEHWIKAAPGWYISTRYMTNGHWAKLAGLGVFDWAVPLDWQKQHQSELNKRGGAVWWYDNDKRWGEPLYFDTVKKMAMSNIKKHAPRK